jgi:hypothetical protein
MNKLSNKKFLENMQSLRKSSPRSWRYITYGFYPFEREDRYRVVQYAKKLLEKEENKRK